MSSSELLDFKRRIEAVETGNKRLKVDLLKIAFCYRNSSSFIRCNNRQFIVPISISLFQAQCKRLRKKFDCISAKLRSTDSKLLLWSLCRKYRDFAHLVDEVKESNDALKTSIEESRIELLERATQLESVTIEIKRLKKLFNSGKISVK